MWHVALSRVKSHFCLCFCFAVITEEPEFTETIENVTVPAGNKPTLIIDSFRKSRLSNLENLLFPLSFLGRNVKLACSVKNLGSYKVRVCWK